MGDGRRAGQHQLKLALSSSNPCPLPPAPSSSMLLVDSSPPLLFRWQLVGVTCMFTAAKIQGTRVAFCLSFLDVLGSFIHKVRDSSSWWIHDEKPRLEPELSQLSANARKILSRDWGFGIEVDCSSFVVLKAEASVWLARPLLGWSNVSLALNFSRFSFPRPFVYQ